MSGRKDEGAGGVPARRPLSSVKPPVLERIVPEERAARRPLDRNRLIMGAAIIVVIGQLVLPETLKPFHLAGDAAAQFHGALFDEVNRKELELAQQRAIAERMAELQAEYATWRGLCSLTHAFEPELGEACLRGAEAHYENALRQIRNSELLYQD